jgi:archaellum biogenesis protein FlaJ (TadC family)
VATVVCLIIGAAFLLIIGGTILQALSDIFFSILGWAIILGLIVAGVYLGQINTVGYVLTALGFCLMFCGGGE